MPKVRVWLPAGNEDGLHVDIRRAAARPGHLARIAVRYRLSILDIIPQVTAGDEPNRELLARAGRYEGDLTGEDYLAIERDIWQAVEVHVRAVNAFPKNLYLECRVEDLGMVDLLARPD